MEIIVKRFKYSENLTLSKLYIDNTNTFECYILEDRVRGEDEEKVYGKTAIPSGRYKIKITYSPRFKVRMPLLLDVPNFLGVRIHPGNRPEDTEGCLLTGKDYSEDWVSESRDAYFDLFKKINEAEEKGEDVWIEIIDDKSLIIK